MGAKITIIGAGNVGSTIAFALSDEDIAFLEDMSDTYSDLESRIGEDWEMKYYALDQEWRQKYIDRFNGEVENDADFIKDPVGSDEEEIEYEKPKTYEDLFKVGEE